MFNNNSDTRFLPVAMMVDKYIVQGRGRTCANTLGGWNPDSENFGQNLVGGLRRVRKF